MTREDQYDFYCYRANVRNQLYSKRKDTQISPITRDKSFSPPPYDIKTIGTTPNKTPNFQKKQQNICKCNPKTWKSTANLYNKQDTTIVDDEGPLSNNLDYPDGIDDTVQQHKIRKQKKGHLRSNKNKGSYKLAPKKKEHKTKEINNKNVAIDKLLKNPMGNGDKKICQRGLCKKNINAGKKHSCKCKNVKEQHQKTTTCNDKSCNVYKICNLPRTCLQVISSVLRIGKNNTQQSIDANKNISRNPMFAIRVDSSSLQVLNPNEIRTKVRKFGTVGKTDKCICPSRLEKAKRYGIGETCEGGVCESARHGKYDKFNCHCRKTDLVECCDTTCDGQTVKGKTKKTARILKKVTPNKPVFEMVLDNNHMNVLNTGEIHEVLRKASYSEMCPTGICRATANMDKILNCKCLSKKIAPILHECNKKTCQPAGEKSKKKSKFYICTKICNSLENWYCKKSRGDVNNDENADLHHINKNKPAAKIQTPAKVKPKVKAVVETTEVQQSAVTKPKRSRLCFICSRIYSSLGNRMYVSDVNGQAGGDTKRKIGRNREHVQNEPPSKQKVSELKSKPMHTIKTNKKQLQIRRKRTQLFKSVTKIKQWTRKTSFAGATNKAMAKMMKEKEKHISKEARKREKLLLKKEKQIEKEKLKRKKELELHSKGHHLNCLATFVIGLVNFPLQTVKGLLTAIISIIVDPIHSYIYTKHRIKDPVGTCKMFKNWFINTWTARDTKISSMVENSQVIGILSDHLEDSAIFQMCTNKGQTQEERRMYEKKTKKRKRRIRKRQQQAVYSCRHTLLMTLRKHPCLCIYHICPFFYPQCLSLLSFMKNFFHLLLYLVALLCWTPCIMCMEVVRAFLCCVVCTQ